MTLIDISKKYICFIIIMQKLYFLSINNVSFNFFLTNIIL